jgi:hypothetical protein
MDIQSLIRLANQADFEGNYRVADKLTERAIRQAASIFRRSFDGFTSVGPTMMALLNGGNIVGTKKQLDPTHVLKKGKWVSPTDAARIDAAHAQDLAAAKAARPARGGAGAAAPSGAPGTAPSGAPVAQSATGGPVTQSAGGAAQTVGGPNGSGVHQTAGGGGPVAQSGVNVHNYYNQPSATPSRTRTKGNKGDKGDKGDTGSIGATGLTGGKGDTGLQGAAGAWWPGVVAGLASGLLTTAGVAAWLSSRGADDNVIKTITQKVNNPNFKANQLAARTEANQMGNQQAAQDFIEARKGTPGFNTAQDFYYAAQAEGLDQSMMNQIAALAKAEGMRDLTRFRD